LVPDDVLAAAKRLIDNHGRHAAGKAFSEALAHSVAGREEEEAYWLGVAEEIMAIQRRAETD
jgi:hypothetical protein